jgi:uncharacterized membrane protein
MDSDNNDIEGAKETDQGVNDIQTRQVLNALTAFKKAADQDLLKSMAYTQKATLLKLLEELNKSDQDENKAAEEAEKLMRDISDSIVNTLSNLAVLSALVGITTYTGVISPSSPSNIDPPSSSSVVIPRLTTVLNIACTSFAMLTICLATSYIYILMNLLVEAEDMIWLIVHVPVVNQCLLFCVLSVLLATLSLLISCFSLYSKTTANVCVISGTCLLASFFFIILPILRKVFRRVDLKFLRKPTKEESILKSR